LQPGGVHCWSGSLFVRREMYHGARASSLPLLDVRSPTFFVTSCTCLLSLSWSAWILSRSTVMVAFDFRAVLPVESWNPPREKPRPTAPTTSRTTTARKPLISSPSLDEPENRPPHVRERPVRCPHRETSNPKSAKRAGESPL